MGADHHVESARRVYDAAAEAYVDFVGTELSDATEDAVDLSILAGFIQLVRAVDPVGKVADLGCGPGRAAAHLARHLSDVVGVDLSSELLLHAARAHPGLPFAQGRLDELPFADDTLCGIVCWYSIIYTPPSHLARLFDEVARVTIVNGLVLMAFQTGSGEAVAKEDAHATGLELTTYLHDVNDVRDRLDEAGLQVHAYAIREPSRLHETSRQAFVIARES
jgi:SAM-dependent methyltransferase